MVLLAYANAMEVEAVVEMMVVIEVVMIVKMMVGREGRDAYYEISSPNSTSSEAY